MRKYALAFTLVLFCGVIAYAGPETIRTSSKEMKETVAPAPPECDFTWTGFYLGGNGGWAWGDGHTRFTPLPDSAGFFNGALVPNSLDADIDGGFLGGQLGFNWQIGRHFVIGAETDLDWADIDGTTFRSPVPSAPPPFPTTTFEGTQEDVNWFGTFRGRLGFVPFCRVLIYGTGGLAYGDADHAAIVDYASVGGPVIFGTSNDTNVGWAGGGGLEFAISRHWTIKAEYLYIDLGDESTTVQVAPQFRRAGNEAVRFRWDNDFHTIKGGLNFKF